MARKKPQRRRTNTRTKTSWRRWFFYSFITAAVLLATWAVWLDAQVRERFDGQKWTLPAKVYARPLLLYPGQLLTAEQLLAELQWSDYHADVSLSRPGTYRQQGQHFVIHRRAFKYWDGPEGSRLLTLKINQDRVESVAEGSQPLALVRLEPQYIGGIFPAHHEDRELVRIEDVPPALIAALIHTEDRDFASHWGVSVKGIARAMLANLRAGGVVQGGSTLTQQLVKNFYLTNERSFIRKANEAIMALLLELHYSKAEIMQAYLNEVYLGQSGRRAIHGFGLASRFYFAKPLNELHHEEIALLVGLVKGASFYNPRRHPQRAKERRDLVLDIMAEHGTINAAERIRAQGKPLQVADAQRAGQREYPAFLELARQHLQQEYRLEDLQTEGLRVFTTLDPWAQHAVEQSARTHLQRLEQRFPVHKNQLEVAAVITSVDGGEINALLGGREAEFFGFNRALNAKRTIGSLAKPMVYLTALENERWHWGSPVDDGPVKVDLGGGNFWEPKNFDRQSHGTMPMVDALAFSYNQATARLGMQAGLSNVAANFKRLGVQENLPPYPSILLGSIPLSPVQVASMYQGIASQGFVMPLRTIKAVTDGHGTMLSTYAMRGKQEFSPELMQWLTWGLEQTAERGTARALKSSLPMPVAAKTGTSNDQRDAWFVGFDNRHLGVIWVGRDDNQPTPLVGGNAALPIWQASFQRMGVEPLPELNALGWVTANTEGELVGDGCAGSLYPMPHSKIPSTLSACRNSSDKKKRKSWLDWLF